MTGVKEAVLFTRLETLGRPMQPTRAHEDDAGYDLYASEARNIAPGEFADIPTGIAVQLPLGTWGLLTGRSSTLRKRGLLVNQGIIDHGYRGELFAGVQNLSGQPVQVLPGERLAQLIIMPNLTEMTEMLEVQQLADHERGTNGFGSSGR